MEVLTERRLLTWCGLSTVDLSAALRAIAESDAVFDKRILNCRVAPPGEVLLVTTGAGHGGCSGGGCYVLLERAAVGWSVAEVEGWRS
jgi:hypothetical protein